MIDRKTAVWCGWSHTQPPCSRRVQVPRPIIIQPCLLVQLLGVKHIWRSPTAIAFFHKHLTVRDIHHILGNVSVKVSLHGGAAEVVGMVEVAGAVSVADWGAKSANNGKSPPSQQNDWLFTWSLRKAECAAQGPNSCG